MSENEYKSELGTKNRLARVLWSVIYIFLFRPFPTKVFRSWRNFLLKLFGAKLHPRAGVYANVKIWAPWNLVMEDNAWLGPNVNCYNVNKIIIKKDATVSQSANLCTASHNIYKSSHDLITAPIIIEEKAWIAIEAFIGMGVTIGEGAVVGARAAVFKDVAPWTIVGGNPAKFIKNRVINE